MLGASAWPNSRGFQASQAFVRAAQGFKDYLLDPHGFGLTTANLLDQFDAQTSASDQLELLGAFLEERTQALSAANQAVRDVLVYFVGHGGFAGPSADFYLLLRRTNASSLRASGMAIDALADVLREKARQMRRYLFLDCCFAAAAFRAFQGGPDQTAITKTQDAFAVQARSSGFPRRGTVLLCSSDQRSPSLLLPDESCTMFSYALLNILRNGDLHRPRQLSLRDLKELAEDQLAALPEQNAPRPGLHSPDQSEGDVADVPFFPNPSVRLMEKPLQVFCCYAREDQPFLLTLRKHLRSIQREGLITVQADIDISPGEAWEQKINHYLNTAQMILLLISPDFMDSDYCFSKEMKRTMERHENGEARVIPIILRPSHWHRAPFGKLHVLPANSEPVLSKYWHTPDDAFFNVTKGIEKAIEDLIALSPTPTPIRSGTLLYTYRGHSNQVLALAWSLDGRRIASGSRDNTVQVWDATDGRNVFIYRGHSHFVNTVAWSPDGQHIASGSEDGVVQVWDAANGGNIFIYRGHASVVSALAWSHNGRRIASGSDDQTVQVWDAVDGGNVYTYRRHSGPASAVAWSPDGQHIASTSHDSTVQVCDATTGANALTYQDHSNVVLAVAWSPDSRRIASGGWDKTVRVWEAG
jgi:WD40 repeat protein